LPQGLYRVLIVSKLKISANGMSALSVLPIHCTQWVQLDVLALLPCRSATALSAVRFIPAGSTAARGRSGRGI